ncbi:hypothetical protein PCANC_24913 [Puccinia coronata f. sp. avenae]|uniref:Uncharacterized protein n=1 Tax=Puccinia coronata f. sp. avenae TaxID=200324 RepID=A0A2N5U3P3_9BASI|nr:hypothetical protein PCANC_24913 [Puccinia coronata f. sp. avenae]
MVLPSIVGRDKTNIATEDKPSNVETSKEPLYPEHSLATAAPRLPPPSLPSEMDVAQGGFESSAKQIGNSRSPELLARSQSASNLPLAARLAHIPSQFPSGLFSFGIEPLNSSPYSCGETELTGHSQRVLNFSHLSRANDEKKISRTGPPTTLTPVEEPVNQPSSPQTSNCRCGERSLGIPEGYSSPQPSCASAVSTTILATTAAFSFQGRRAINAKRSITAATAASSPPEIEQNESARRPCIAASVSSSS